MDIKQFYQTFFEEADELLAEMELLLLGLDVQSPDIEHLNAIFRAAHPIKGGAATFGFAALTETTHLLENLLDKARHGQLLLSKKMMDGLLEAKDVLQKQLSAYRADSEPEPAMVERICSVLRQLAVDASTEASVAPVLAPVAVVQSAAELAAKVPAGRVLNVCFSGVSENDRKLLSEELANLGTVLEQTQDSDKLNLRLETGCDADDVIAVCCFIIDADQIQITVEPASSAPAAPAPVSSVPAPPPPVAEVAPPPEPIRLLLVQF